MPSAPICEEIGDGNSVDGQAVQTRVDYRSAGEVGFVDTQARQIDIVDAPAGHVRTFEGASGQVDLRVFATRKIDVVKARAGKVHVVEGGPRQIGVVDVESILLAFDPHLVRPARPLSRISGSSIAWYAASDSR